MTAVNKTREETDINKCAAKLIDDLQKSAHYASLFTEIQVT